ncbi:hypothetical protein Ocin01_17852, partial [Orchesella cincta]
KAIETYAQHPPNFALPQGQELSEKESDQDCKDGRLVRQIRFLGRKCHQHSLPKIAVSERP